MMQNNSSKYDKTGSLTCDGNRGIALIDYDNQAYPTRIQFIDGSVTSYEYTADGRRLKTKHETAVEGITVPVNTRHELTNAETLAKDSTEYLGNFRYHNNEAIFTIIRLVNPFHQD